MKEPEKREVWRGREEEKGERVREKEVRKKRRGGQWSPGKKWKEGSGAVHFR